MSSKVPSVLLLYRITPQSTTGISPGEMVLGRKRNLLHPDLQLKVLDKQCKQKQYHDNKWKVRGFLIGDALLAINFSYGAKWFIAKETDSLLY